MQENARLLDLAANQRPYQHFSRPPIFCYSLLHLTFQLCSSFFGLADWLETARLMMMMKQIPRTGGPDTNALCSSDLYSLHVVGHVV